MDNLVSQGTGASRLSFPQKIIASGMSVILAFGLSPLGQVPAYAAGNEGGDTPPLMLAQDGGGITPITAEESAKLTWNYKVGNLVYTGDDFSLATGGDLYGADVPVGGSGANKDKVVHYKGDVQTVGLVDELTVLVDTGSADTTKTYDVSLAALKEAGSTLAFFYADSADKTKASRKAVELAGDQLTPIHAGDYVLKVTVANEAYASGDGASSAKFINKATFTIPFTIAPYNIETNNAKPEVTFNDDVSSDSGKIKYTGKAADFKKAIKQIKIEQGNKEIDPDEEGPYLEVKAETIDTAAAEADRTSDFSIDPLYQTKTEPGKYDVDFVMSGDFEGKFTAPIEITRIALQNENVLINGVKANTAAPEGKTLADVFGIAAQSSGDEANPIESIVVGNKTLEEGVDYSITYIDKKKKEYDTKPTAADKYTIAVRTLNDSLYLDEFGDGTYSNSYLNINGFQIVNSTKGFKELDVAKATVANGTFKGGEAVEATGVKFFDSYGHEITDEVNGNYTVTYTKWTPAMEKSYLGETVFNARYAKDGYDNSNTIDVSYDETDAEQENPIYTLRLDENNKPVAAGDYGVIISSTSKDGGVEGLEFDSAKDTTDSAETGIASTVDLKDVPDTLYAKGDLVKLHIDPLQVEQGTANGQVNIVPSTSGAWSREYNVQATQTKGVAGGLALATVEYIKDSTKTGDDRAAALAVDDDYTLKIARSDGKELKDNKPLEVGTYDATIEFQGDYAGEVTLASGFEVTPFDLSKYASQITLNNGTYAGRALTPYDIENANGAIATAYTHNAKLKVAADYNWDWVDKTILALSGSDVTWKGTPTNPSAAKNEGYTITITGTGNYTGSVSTAEAAFKVAPLDLASTKIQFRNAGDPVWTDGATAAGEAPGEPFIVALDENGKAIPPEVRLVVVDDEGEIVKVKGSDGKESEVVIPATVYGGAPDYAKNTKAGNEATATILATSNPNFSTGDSAAGQVQGFFKVVGADQTPEQQGYSIELGKQTATFNAKKQDPALKVYQTVGETKVEASPSDYTVTVTSKKDSSQTSYAACDFTNADTYTVSVSFKNLAGSLMADYTIDPLKIEQADVQSDVTKSTGLVINVKSEEYTSDEIDFSQVRNNAANTGYLTVNYNGVAVPQLANSKAEGTGYVIDAKAFKQTNVNTYTGTFEFKGNMEGTVTQTFEITPVDVTKVLGAAEPYQLYFDGEMVEGNEPNELAKPDYKFDGLAKAPVITMAYYGKEVATDADMRIETLGDTTNVGNFVVNILFTGGNYKGTAVVKATINPRPINDSAIVSEFKPEEIAYNGGKVVQPKGTLTLRNTGDGYVLQEGKDYTIKYEGEAKNVGDKGTVVYEAASTGNFWTGTGKLEVPFEVQAAKAVDQEITAANVSVVAGKTAAINATAKTTLSYKSSDETIAKVDPATGVVTGVKAGTAKITISAAATDEFNAAEKTIDVTVTAAPSVKPSTPSVSVKSANSLKIAKVTRTVKGVKAGKLAKAKTVAGAKVKTKGQGTVTWTKVKVVKGKKAVAKKVAKKITVNKKNGKITVKKGLAKGTYKVTVSAKAAGDATHNTKTVKAVVTLKVKK